MEIILGKTAGFCYGVNNAVTKTEEYVRNIKNKKIYCLGELVHNKDVIDKLEREGLNFIVKIDETDKNNLDKREKSLIIRAHGEPKATYKTLKEQNIEILDLTCPNVLVIHDIVEKYVNNNYYIFFIAEKGHPEVVGTYSFCDGECSIIENEDDIDVAFDKILEKNKNKILVVSQTTFRIEKFEKYVEEIISKVNILNNKGEGIILEVRNTICNATRLRQEETEKLSKIVDYMIVIGGKNSSNTRKLYDISVKNCENSILIQNYIELEKEYKEELEKIKKLSKIGIMAGASTPKDSIEDVINLIKRFGR